MPLCAENCIELIRVYLKIKILKDTYTLKVYNNMKCCYPARKDRFKFAFKGTQHLGSKL